MLVTVITFLIVLTFLVFVHELGHFLVARKAGVKVYEFGLGLPPRLVGIRRQQDNPKKWEILWGSGADFRETVHTIYSLNWLPIGGFVRPKGEDESAKGADSLFEKPPGTRALVAVAGVFMNFLAAAVLLSAVYAVGMPAVIDEKTNPDRVSGQQVEVLSVIEGSPAAQGQLLPGDVLVGLDAVKPKTISQVQAYIGSRENQDIAVQIQRGGETKETLLTPVRLDGAERPAIGVSLVEIGAVSYPLHQAIWRGVAATGVVTVEILKALGTIVSGGLTASQLQEQIAGPVGIAVITGEFVEMGFVYVLQFAALLSINLGIINIMPFPALDGGRLFFILIEKIRGRAVSSKVENIVHTVGFALLIILILFVTFNDFSRFGPQILGAVKGIF